MNRVLGLVILAAFTHAATAEPSQEASHNDSIGGVVFLGGGGLMGIGIKAKGSLVVIDGGVFYSPGFFWEWSTAEKDTGPSMGYFAQIGFPLSGARAGHDIETYALFRLGEDAIYGPAFFAGFGVEASDRGKSKMALLAEFAVGYRLGAAQVEERIESTTGESVAVRPGAIMLRLGFVFF